MFYFSVICTNIVEYDLVPVKKHLLKQKSPTLSGHITLS